MTNPIFKRYKSASVSENIAGDKAGAVTYARKQNTPFSDTEEFLKVKLLDPRARVPTRGSALAAGYDLCSSQKMVIEKNKRGVVPTGIAIKVPSGTYGRVAPRSGLTFKFGIDTGAGVVDEDYTGEIKVILFNHGEQDFFIEVGDRIAQLVLEKIKTPNVLVVDELSPTDRGDNGFGSTGV